MFVDEPASFGELDLFVSPPFLLFGDDGGSVNRFLSLLMFFDNMSVERLSFILRAVLSVVLFFIMLLFVADK